MKLFEFLNIYGSQETIIRKLRNDGLLIRNATCPNCGEQMREMSSAVGDGSMFYCRKRSCRKALSVRTNSFFQKSKLNLCEMMLILHLWSKEYSEKLIREDFGFSRQTVVDWARYCRELCVYEFEHDENTIGGVGKVVEIDETLLIKRKYNRGRIPTNGWLFGGIERNQTGEFKCFVKIVYDRSEPHLTSIIRNYIMPGTHIISDGWAAYRNLSSQGYIHSVINHNENFVSTSDNEIHTQTIESRWSSLKRFLRNHGAHKGPFILEYVCEYLFRKKHLDVFDELLSVIRTEYQLN